MPLDEYRKKRRFNVTSEPEGKVAAKVTKTKAVRRPKPLAFVVQKHRATALHYDVRLEWKGVMMSWAVPKGPSYDPTIKRLAMQVEDHPVEYNKFEGIIPEGEYGGGTVMIWDQGTWKPESLDVDAALKKGDLKFTFEGKKLRGSWVLVRTSGRGPAGRGQGAAAKNVAGPGANNTEANQKTAWLLIKHRDEWTSNQDVTDLFPRSVVSDRLLIEIARDEGGDLLKAADGDPLAAKAELLANPALLAPAKKKGRKKSVWHSNRGGAS